MSAEYDSDSGDDIANAQTANELPITQLQPVIFRPLTWWVDYIDGHADAGLRPKDISPLTQERFGLMVHRMVADNVSVDLSHLHKSGAVLRRNDVIANLQLYYRRFPAPNPALYYEDIVRYSYQDEMFEAVRANVSNYPELSVALALRHAYHEARLKHATIGVVALISSYGRTILNLPSVGVSELPK